MSSKDYWNKREAEALKHYITDEKEYDKRLKSIYESMTDAIQAEIDGFYGRYASAEGITIAEAKKRASKLDMDTYERKAERYVRDRDFSKTANDEMRLYNMTMKVNRLELLKANIGLELVDGFDDLQKCFEQILTDRTLDEFKRQAGILGNTIQDNAKAAKAIVNAPFHNATFSDRIWMYQDAMKSELSKLLQSGLIQGKNPRQLSRSLEQLFGVGRKNAERLMRTELARVQTEVQRQSFIENRFTDYTFIANRNCCPICAALDGKHFKVKDMMPGENASPMHPHCRCSAAPYEDDEEYEAWLDYLSKGGTTEEWKKNAKDVWRKKNNKSLENSLQNSTIKSGAVSGALTSKNDPDFSKRTAFADSYHSEVRNRKREYEIAAVAKNSGFKLDDIDKVFAHVFELEHLFEDGTIHRFDTDYDMAQSWIRLRNGKGIQEHDIILLRHELMEAEIMGNGLSVPYEQAHQEASKKYNYKEALIKYLKANNLE